jgi:hypothetical protein
MPDKDRHDAWARNFNKFRLAGIRGSIAGVISRGDGGNITEDEEKSLTHTTAILDDILDRYESNSTSLGFKDVGRRVGVNTNKVVLTSKRKG